MWKWMAEDGGQGWQGKHFIAAGPPELPQSCSVESQEKNAGMLCRKFES